MRGGQSLFLWAGTLAAMVPMGSVSAQEFQFAWDRATVYAVATEHFVNGDPGNDTMQVSQLSDGGGSSLPHAGGDFAGLRSKIDEGYFTALGVDVLNISSVFSAPGTGAFSAQWPVDYTSIAPHLGSAEDFRRLVDRAHERGIRVVVSVDLPGANNGLRLDSTAAAAGPLLGDVLGSTWDAQRTEAELEDLRAFFTRSGYDTTNVSVAVNWLSDFVAEYGVDGYRVMSPDRVVADGLSRLKSECAAALNVWKKNNPAKALNPQVFWLIGDGMTQGLDRTPPFDFGVDAMLATTYGSFPNVDSVYSAVNLSTTSDPAFNIVSSAATGPGLLFESKSDREAAANLMLLPGLVQIAYGEEAGETSGGRIFGTGGATPDWDAGDDAIRAHWSKLGSFRKRHPAVGGGSHVKLSDDPYAFYRGMRLGTDTDEVIIVMGASGRVRLNVSKVFPNDTVMREAYSGKLSIVSYGEVEFQAGEDGILLLEPLK